MTDTKSIDTIQPRDTSGDTIVVPGRGTMRGTLYRIISTLDADIHVTLEATDGIDGDSFNASETLPIGGESTDPDDDTKLITDGSSTTQAESTLLTEGWHVIRFTITAQTTPTTGSVELRSVTDF
jgi:hypothetical protein